MIGVTRIRTRYTVAGAVALVAAGAALTGVLVCDPAPRTSERCAAPREIHVKVAATVADPLAVVDAASRGEVAPVFARAAAAIRAERPAGAPDLTRWVELAACDDPDRTVATLRGTAGVVDAFVEPDTVLADMPIAAADRRDDGDSCPIKTPEYNELQGYLEPAPGGIDAVAAWREPGGRGAGVWFADVEGGWNAAHEDIPGDRIRNVAGRPTGARSWSAHGTAVVGEIAGRDNRLGMHGIAPDVERIFTASIFGSSVADAIDQAQAAMRPGDVLLIELQRTGPRRRYLPVEFWDDVYEVIELATARGIIVVEAAGNGAENLDHRSYRGKLDRAGRDSGAILVGAGAPPRDGFVDRSRLDFSNYGSRVDVQGWGRRVATLDYGDLQACDTDSPTADRDYTAQFGGTSSASPIVAGSALVLQGIALARDGRPVTPAQMRRLLRATGTPQTDGPHGPVTEQIGPRPDLARAIHELDEYRR
jgi:subtilisin family serine protease